MKYISFDNYYSQSDYNTFIQALKVHKIPFQQFIRITPPYNWFLRVDDEDIPKYLFFDETRNIRNLVSPIVPKYPNEESILKRRDSDPQKDITKFVENDVLRIARTSPFVLVFYFNGQKAKDYSREIDERVYVLGTKAGYLIGIVFNPYFQNVIDPTSIIFTESSGDYRNVGEIEERINYVWKPNLKLQNKSMITPYYYKGAIYNNERPLFKLP